MDAAQPLSSSMPSSQSAMVRAWPRSAQLTTAFLLGIVATLITTRVLSYTRWGSKPTELVSGAGSAYRIDVNRADRAELLQLPGIGAALADRIETHRGRTGSFRSAADLMEVDGIGPAKLERMRQLITIDGGEVEPNVEKKNVAKVTAGAAPIDINSASSLELQRLPGIGPKLAQRIIEERRTRPFRSVDDLNRVPGIGAKKLEAIRPFVTIQQATEQTVLKP